MKKLLIAFMLFAAVAGFVLSGDFVPLMYEPATGQIVYGSGTNAPSTNTIRLVQYTPVTNVFIGSGVTNHIIYAATNILYIHGVGSGAEVTNIWQLSTLN